MQQEIGFNDALRAVGAKQLIIERQGELIEAQGQLIRELEAKLESKNIADELQHERETTFDEPGPAS